MQHGVRIERQLRRLCWQLTAMFTAATVLCLVVLAAIVLAVDQDSRRNALDGELSGRAKAASRTAFYEASKQKIDASYVGGDTNSRGPFSLVIIDWVREPHGAVIYPPKPPLGPPDLATLRRLRDQVTEDANVHMFDFRGPAGPLRAAAVGMTGPNQIIGGLVVVIGDPHFAQAGHGALTRRLAAGCLLLAQLAAVSGYLLARFSIRPAARALTRQEQFLAEAAHELRTPLATLRLVAQAGVADPARHSAALQDTVRLADRLGYLVAGLLTRARLQAGTQRAEHLPLRLDQLVEQVIEDMPDDGGAVSVRAEPTVVAGDPELLAQAVRNLTENALRHGADAAGQARVEITVAAQALEVRDFGAGPGAAIGTAGTGIGLSIVSWVAELHGGQFALTAAPGGGALARLQLPVPVPTQRDRRRSARAAALTARQ